jgi:iron(III) transport system substrate-binding protein
MFKAIRMALMGVVLAGAPALAQDMTAHEKELYDAAKANGEQVTWYVAHYSAETAETLGAKFQELYPGINVNVI